MVQPRCGVKDFPSVMVGRRKRQIMDFGKWPKNQLTYRMAGRPSRMHPEVADNEIRRAFGMWSTVADVSLTQVPDLMDADMEIAFVKGDHGKRGFISPPFLCTRFHSKGNYDQKNHIAFYDFCDSSQTAVVVRQRQKKFEIPKFTWKLEGSKQKFLFRKCWKVNIVPLDNSNRSMKVEFFNCDSVKLETELHFGVRYHDPWFNAHRSPFCIYCVFSR